MPTYTYRCDECGELRELVMGILRYVNEPPDPQCCGHSMQRYFGTAPCALFEADYTGLRASDGTDISSRAKHRAYMREHGLTTVDDFRETWKRDYLQREQRMAGVDPERARDIARAIAKLGG